MAARPSFAVTPARTVIQFGGTAVTSRIPTAATNMGLLVDGATNGTLITRIRVMPTNTISSAGCITLFIHDTAASTIFNLFRDIAYGTQTPSTTVAATSLYDERFPEGFTLKATQNLYIASTVANTLAAAVEAADL